MVRKTETVAGRTAKGMSRWHDHRKAGYRLYLDYEIDDALLFSITYLRGLVRCYPTALHPLRYLHVPVHPSLQLSEPSGQLRDS
jgi:hypothetical protein